MTLEMRDQYGRPIGLCVVNRPTRIRHSCTPNAYVAFPEGLDAQDPLRIISLEEIRGDEEVRLPASWLGDGLMVGDCFVCERLDTVSYACDSLAFGGV
jgi:hypothetical protein